MRILLALVFAAVASSAVADEVDEAQKLALQGHNSYWNCLSREYSREADQIVSPHDFTADIASACPSERQNFRVTLLGYLNLQFPDADADAHLTTANHAIELAQKDMVTAFIRHKRGGN